MIISHEAIKEIYPNAVTINGDTVETITCLDNDKKIVIIDFSLLPKQSKTEISDNITNLVQKKLDTTSKEWGYDTIYTAVGYIGDPNPTFNSEAIMFRNWRSAVWVYVNAEQVKLQNAQRTMPTDAELIAELPLLDTYK